MFVKHTSVPVLTNEQKMMKSIWHFDNKILEKSKQFDQENKKERLKLIQETKEAFPKFEFELSNLVKRGQKKIKSSESGFSSSEEENAQNNKKGCFIA